MKIVRPIIVAAILLVALILVGGSLALAQGQSTGGSGAQQPEGSSVVRIYYPDREALDAISWELDIWEAHPDQQYIVALVTPEKRQKIESLGYRVETDVEKTAKLAPLAPLDPRYYYFDDYYTNPNGLYIVNFLEDTNAAYPNLTELIDIGDAWQGLHMGYHRDMWVLRITNEDPAYGDIATKPTFVLFANTHAREVATPELAIRYIKYLLTGYLGAGGYGIDADATWLVNHNVVYVEVSDNPDGRVINEQDTSAYWRKNVDNDDGCNYQWSWGTDLNRNFSFKWNSGGSDSDPCGETYHGPSAGSEPEVNTFQDWVRTIIPDQNGPNGDNEIPPAAPITTTGIFISLHSYSDLVLWPWGFTSAPAPNSAQLQTIGRKFAFYNNYTPQQSWQLYQTSGTTDEYTYGKLGIPSYTFEVGGGGGICSDFFPSYDCIDGTNGAPRNFWAEDGPAFLYAHKIARTPYMTAYGPDTEDVVALPGSIAPGDPVTLNATITDHRYGGDPLLPITAAEYFIDNPGADGTGTPMSAADGDFGETTEDVTAAVDTSALISGQHYILVHGLNDSGNWGPFTAVFLYVLDPEVAPVIQGHVRDAVNNLPLVATITAGMFAGATDPETGFYNMMVISGTYDIQAQSPDHLTATAEGVVAQDYATVTQDFFLQPLCTVFNDDVENGNQGWTASTPWAITDEASNSPTHSWTDSPGGNYSNNRNTSLTSQSFDLSAYSGVTLIFSHIYDTEPNFDYGHVEYSTNGGTTWTQAVQYSGWDHTTWTQEQVDLSALDGISNAKIRFRFTSDGSQVGDGWHIDDIQLSATGGDCITPLPPTADFTSDSPVVQGDPMHFTNLVYGTPPLDYLWDFGDGVGTSTESDPTYTYTSAGTFTVTLTATNTLGSDSISKPVIVNLVVCEPVSEVDLSLTTPGVIYPGDEASFSANFLPDDATKPYTYTVDYGDSTPPEEGSSVDDPLILHHAYAAAGDFQVTISVWNCDQGSPVTDSTSVTISPYIQLTSVDLTLVTTGTIYAGTLVDFSADLAPDDANKPYTYTVSYGDGGIPVVSTSSDDPLALNHVFETAGSYDVLFSAWNEGMLVPVTDSVKVEVSGVIQCVPLTGVTINGATEGFPGVYTFTLSYEPQDASLPIDFLWDNGDTGATSTRTLDAGEHLISVTATNCVEVTVEDDHTIVITPFYKVSLPIILR